MRISLCVIAGNEEHHIERMLNSFAPAFDELSLVRAIGSRKADRTLSIARDWAEANRKDFVFSEHVNQPGTEGWDHVDSFAAARNDSFRQASGDWLIWCDCDDVLPDADKLRGALRVRFARKGEALEALNVQYPELAERARNSGTHTSATWLPVGWRRPNRQCPGQLRAVAWCRCHWCSAACRRCAIQLISVARRGYSGGHLYCAAGGRV